MTYTKRKKASEQMFAAAAEETVAETTPSVVTKVVRDFAAELSTETLEQVPVIADEFAFLTGALTGLMRRFGTAEARFCSDGQFGSGRKLC